MKNLIQKISILSFLIVSLLLVISCNEDDNGTTIDQTLVSRFTRTLNKKTLTFINISENATSYVWDFGDGTTSTLINPVKTYLNGNYTVTLTAKNTAGETSMFTDSISIDGCTDETTERTRRGVYSCDSVVACDLSDWACLSPLGLEYGRRDSARCDLVVPCDS